MYILFIINFLFAELNNTNISNTGSNKEAKELSKILKIKNLKEIIGKKEESFLKVAKIDKDDEKIFYVEVDESNKDLDLELGKAFLIYTYDEKSFYKVIAKAIYVKEEEIEGKKYYKFTCYVKLRAVTLNNVISYIGKPTLKGDLAKYNHAMMDYSNISRELGDMNFGSMSLYVSYGWSKLSTSSSGPSTIENPFEPKDGGYIYSSEINSKKNYSFYETYNLAFRWWFSFLSSLGMDINYFFTSDIPTITKKEFSDEDAYFSSSFKGYAISLMYRRSFFRMPAMFGLKYFIDNFETSFTGDKLLSSSYSGLNVNFSWHFPYQFTMLPLGFAKMVFHDFELNAGLSPIVTASDKHYSRGSRSSISSYRLGSSILFNFESKHIAFLKNIFFGFMYEYLTYNLSFTGATKPEGELPTSTSSSEKYQYIGLKVKYEFNDPFGDE